MNSTIEAVSVVGVITKSLLANVAELNDCAAVAHKSADSVPSPSLAKHSTSMSADVFDTTAMAHGTRIVSDSPSSYSNGMTTDRAAYCVTDVSPRSSLLTSQAFVPQVPSSK
jgi:hypothetical protein